MCARVCLVTSRKRLIEGHYRDIDFHLVILKQNFTSQKWCTNKNSNFNRSKLVTSLKKYIERAYYLLKWVGSKFVHCVFNRCLYKFTLKMHSFRRRNYFTFFLHKTLRTFLVSDCMI